MRRILVITFLIFFVSVLFYQFQFSESAKIQNNLKELELAKEFHSSEVDVLDLKNIERKASGYQFTVLSKNEIANYKTLGAVQMHTADGSLINTFILLKDENVYAVYMRGIYMSID